MHTIYRTSDPVQARFTADRLVAAGIPAQVLESDSAFAGTIGGGGQISVVVADADAERAAAALETEPLAAPEPIPAWTCASCGEYIEAGFDACWKCSASYSGGVSIEPGVAAPPLSAAAPAESPVAAEPESRGVVLLELSVVLTLAWLYYLLTALASLATSEPWNPTNLSSLAEGVVAIGHCLLVVLVVWRAGGPLQRHGLVKPHAIDLVHTAVVLVFAIAAEFAALILLVSSGVGGFLVDLYEAAPSIDTQAFEFRPHELSFVASALWLLAMAAGEEFVFRAYLLPRLRDLFGSMVISTLVSTALFASYHCYQGGLGVATTFAFGLVMAIGFWLTRRIWPLVLAHAIINML